MEDEAAQGLEVTRRPSFCLRQTRLRVCPRLHRARWSSEARLRRAVARSTAHQSVSGKSIRAAPERTFYTGRLRHERTSGLTVGGLRRGRTKWPRARLVLTASEIGAYTFCPQAWYLQRHEQPRSRVGEERLRSGAAAHRSIGQRVD